MTSVRIRPRTLGRVRPGLLAPAVIAIILGILGMHGIDAHGANMHGVNMHGASAHAGTATPSLATLPVRELAGEHGDPPSPTHPGMSPHGHPVDAKSDAGDVGDAGGMSGMVMLCVAMLAGAATALLALLARRGRSSRVWAVMQVPRRGWRPAPHALRVGTGPPHVWRFSVIRC